MVVNKVISWVLIFALIMPTVIIASTGTAYAFGGLNFDNNILNILKGLLSLFLLKTFVGEEPKADSSGGQSNLVSNSDENIQSENSSLQDNSDTTFQVKKENNLTSQIIVESEERQMLDLINEARRNKGLPPLKINIKLVEIAREKSWDMINYNYFGHYPPTNDEEFMASYKGNFANGPFPVLSQEVNYQLAGENIAGASNVSLAHQNLMNSTSHRKNILHPDFTHIGIGVIKGGPYGKMYTQEFADLNW